MKTFEMKSRPAQAETTMFLDRYSINVTVLNVGVAFPLIFGHELRAQANTHADTDIRAFLFSIKSVSFGIQRGENGQASMKGFSFQVVPRYVRPLLPLVSYVHVCIVSDRTFPETSQGKDMQHEIGWSTLK